MGPRARSSPKFGSQGGAFRMVFHRLSREALDLGCQGGAEAHGFRFGAQKSGTGLEEKDPRIGGSPLGRMEISSSVGILHQTYRALPSPGG